MSARCLRASDALLLHPGWEESSTRLGTEGPCIRFVERNEWEKLSDAEKEGKGVFVDVKARARVRCGCFACQNGTSFVTGVTGKTSSCQLERYYEEVSLEELSREVQGPTMLYQLMLNPRDVFDNSDSVSFSRGYLDFVLLEPRCAARLNPRPSHGARGLDRSWTAQRQQEVVT